jgi:tRNA pseudouridine55 synthase
MISKALSCGRRSLRPTTRSLKRSFSSPDQSSRSRQRARAGDELVLAPAHVHVFAWRDVVREGDRLRATIACGGGTYIRALARDLGRLTGSAAHLAELRRVRSGPFHVGDAASLETVRAGGASLRPALDALPTIPHVVLVGDDAERVLRGMTVERNHEGTSVALIDERSGALVAFAEAAGSCWQPRVVMRKIG